MGIVNPYEEKVGGLVNPYDDALPPSPSPLPEVAPEKPSLFRRGLSAAGGVLAEIPQIAYEGVAGTANAFARQMSNAMAVPDYVGGILGGGSPEEAAQFANQRIQKNANWNLMPPTLGRGSWVGRGIGYGANKLAESGLLAPEDVQMVGDTLAVAGAPEMFRGVRGAGTAAGKVFPNTAAKIQQRFPSSEVRAGRLIAETEQTLSPELAQGARETTNLAAEKTNLAGAQQRLGVQRLPESADPNIRRQQLATERMGRNVEVKASEFNLADQAAEQATQGLRSGLEVGEVNPAALDFVSKKLEASSKKTALANIESAAKAELDKVTSVIPTTERPAPLPMGQAILKWIRGEGPSGEKVATGIRAVRKVFDKEYEKFNGEKGAVVSSADLQAAIDASASVSADAGHVMRGFVDEARKIEQRLGGGGTPEMLTVAEEAAGRIPGGTVLPKNLTLAQARGIKGEFSAAARLAKAAGNPAEIELNRIASIAREAETAAAKRLGPEKFRQYDAIRSSYENVLVEGFRRGHGGDLTSFGKESGVKGGAKIAPANILDTLVNGKAAAQNAHDFVFAAGAEEAARTGKLLTGLKEADILALGQENARTIVRPYIESQIAEVFNKGGVKNLNKYLDAHRDAFTAYGLDFNDLRTAATKYNESMARLSGAKVAVANDTVAGVIPQMDPTKLGKYVFDNANPKAAYSNLQAVSKDPLYLSSIRTLMVEELKTRIDSGVDVFADAKVRGAMESIFAKPEIRVLQDYHTIMKRLKDSPAHGKGKDLSPHALKLAEKAAELPAVGFGPWYVAKRAVLMALKMKTAAGDAAALSWVDDAFINPAKAKLVRDAWRGHEAAAERIRQGIKEEGMSMTALTKAVAPKVAAPAAGGAISTAGQEGVQDAAKEGE